MNNVVVSGAVASVRAGLRELADPQRAVGQQAYMKSAMAFLGVGVPATRQVAQRCVRQVGDADHLRQIAAELWDGATHREERYAALAVLGCRALRGDWSNLALIERFAREGQWWDIIDELAHRVADLLDAEPVRTPALVRSWSQDPDFWVRRLAILSQLQRGARVDTDLLADVIEPNRFDPEFFICKAIGWALRDYARSNPDWVRTYTDTHQLSPLSYREARKHLG